MISSSPELEKILASESATLHLEDIDGRTLAVKETAEYRWFEYGGQSVQSLMTKAAPEKISTPVSEALLLFLLFDSKPLEILNLGLGGASIERALAMIPSLRITSVEASQPIIEIARRYFRLPKESQVICQKAEQFVKQATTKYDVVLCDLFVDERNPVFLSSQDFYVQLDKITSDEAVILLNIQAETEEELLLTLLSIKQQFPYIVLIEFDGYKNIVLVCSSHEIPPRYVLQERLADYTQIIFTCLDKVIEKMRYLPQRKARSL